MSDTQFILAFKVALSSAGRLTPFAWMSVLGVILMVLGAVILIGSGEMLNLEQRFGRDELPSRGPLQPGEAGFGLWIRTIRFLENGYYVFLAGMMLALIGIYPFVAAASGGS